MNTYAETSWTAGVQGCSLLSPQGSHRVPDIGKRQWLQKYSLKLLKSWLQWQTPLGIASAYAEHIKEDLADFYEDPLKRMFIEATYS